MTIIRTSKTRVKTVAKAKKIRHLTVLAIPIIVSLPKKTFAKAVAKHDRELIKQCKNPLAQNYLDKEEAAAARKHYPQLLKFEENNNSCKNNNNDNNKNNNNNNEPKSKSSSSSTTITTTQEFKPTNTTPLAEKQQSSFLTYENPTYGFNIQYPSNWQKTEQPEAGRVVSFDEINKGVQVYIKYDKLPSQYSTLTQYVNTLVNQLGNDRKDFSLVEYYPNLTLHNNPAYKVVYLSTKKVGVNIGTHYETMRLWIMKGDDVYTLVYVTQPNLFPEYLPIANNMLKSFKLTR